MDEGFTLLEALLALVLMGIIVGTLATVVSQWMPSWNRGLVRAQRNEQIAIALDRMAADLSAAEYVSLARAHNLPFFIGSESGVVFVRSVLGPNNRDGLEIVRIAEMTDSLGTALVRTRAPFTISPNGNPSLDQMPFGDPVVLLRAPLHMTFGYAGRDGAWSKSWRPTDELPMSVRFDIRDADRGTAISTATRIHVGSGAASSNMADPGNSPAGQK